MSKNGMFKAYSGISDYFKRSKLAWWDPEKGKGDCGVKTGKDFQIHKRESIMAQITKIETVTNVLEIGPGRGRFTRDLLKLGKDVTCVEINEGFQVLLEKEFGTNARFVLLKGDITQIDLAMQYSLVTCIDVLVHIPKITDLIQQLYKYVLPGGTLVLEVTPLTWYEENKKSGVVHRGINHEELIKYVQTLPNSTLYNIMLLHSQCKAPQSATLFIRKGV
jgi:2-polyprenyl-3-methyl-5-hydroxy-6-metoxy-1,4-benzoquinol methylase